MIFKKNVKKADHTEKSLEDIVTEACAISKEFQEGSQKLLPATQELLDMASEYESLMFYYVAGIEQITAKLQILNREFQLRNDRNPIEDIKSRVKSAKSIQNKMQRMGVPMTLQNIVTHLHDIAGVRVICPFVKDVYQIADILSAQSDINVLRVKDYIKNPKPNGYRSLHIIITVDVAFSNKKAKIPVELQIRTIAMNFWASLEHQLRYKKEFVPSEAIQRELWECGEIMADADARMQKIADELLGFARE